MYQFHFHQAGSIDDAVAAMGKAEEGKFVAGGQTMLPTMKHRLASPSDVIDLGNVTELRGISLASDRLVIGAMTSHAQVAASVEVRKTIAALAELAGNIGDPAVRNRGTLGGSIANNDPAADYPAALIALDATVKTNKRDIASEDFFTDMFETALEEDELIVSVSFPIPQAAAYRKAENPASRYAIAGVFVATTANGVRIAVTGATACAHRALRLEQALAAKLDPDALDGVELPVDKMNSDIHASAEYRAHLVKVLARRAVAACL